MVEYKSSYNDLLDNESDMILLDNDIKYESDITFWNDEEKKLELRLFFLDNPKAKIIYNKLMTPMTFMEKLNVWFKNLIKTKKTKKTYENWEIVSDELEITEE